MEGELSVSLGSADRYSRPDYVATYLHAEWFDILFKGDARNDEQQIKPGYFYQEAAKVVAEWSRNSGLAVNTICDIGGGTGRLSRELATHFPALLDQVLVEPSRTFCEWALRLIGGQKFDGWIPLPWHAGQPKYERVPPGNLPAPVAGLHIICASAENIPRPTAYFDLITCLNVLDRVSKPLELVQTILRLLRPGGLAVVASPLHFDQLFTSRSQWIEDLSGVLSAMNLNIAATQDLTYAIRLYGRCVCIYDSQIVGILKR
jgi:SAM-dependent methyltransferase